MPWRWPWCWNLCMRLYTYCSEIICKQKRKIGKTYLRRGTKSRPKEAEASWSKWSATLMKARIWNIKNQKAELLPAPQRARQTRCVRTAQERSAIRASGRSLHDLRHGPVKRSREPVLYLQVAGEKRIYVIFMSSFSHVNEAKSVWRRIKVNWPFY